MSDDKLLLSLQRLAKHDLNGVHITQQRDLLGITAGVLIAMRLPLPTTPVSEVVNYYVSTHEPITAKLLDQVNETVFINVLKALEVARNIYMFRYRSVYDDALVLKLLPTLFSGGPGNLPPKILKDLELANADILAKAAEYYF